MALNLTVIILIRIQIGIRKSKPELEALGWKIYCIDDNDWYKNRQETEQKLLKAVEDAKKEQSVSPMHGRHLTESEWKVFYEKYPNSNPEAVRSETETDEETLRQRPQLAWHITEVNGKGIFEVGQVCSREEYQSYQDILSKDGVLTKQNGRKLRMWYHI